MSEIDFEVLKTAKVSDIDLAGLVGVSKAAANHWRTGRSNIHPLRLPKVKRIVELVRLATADGKLPIATMSPTERLAELRTVLKQYVNS